MKRRGERGFKLEEERRERVNIWKRRGERGLKLGRGRF